MDKINPVFKWVALGILALLLLVTLMITLLMGYVMFAPDSLPKPFYFTSQNPSGSTQAGVNTTPQAGHSSESTLPFLTPGVPFEIKPGQGIMFDTGTKIVNLAEPSGRRYIRANIVLEFAPSDVSYYLTPSSSETTQGKTSGEGASAAAAPQTYVEKFKAELEAQRPLIDDTIITLLSSKSFESIYTASGKEQLRKELQTLLNARMPENRIIFIYFTEFTVQ